MTRTLVLFKRYEDDDDGRDDDGRDDDDVVVVHVVVVVVHVNVNTHRMYCGRLDGLAQVGQIRECMPWVK